MWFEAIVLAYTRAIERADEIGARRIELSLRDLAMLQRIEVPGAQCYYCHKAKLEIIYDGDVCNECLNADEREQVEKRLAEEEWQRRWNTMSDAGKEAYVRQLRARYVNAP